MCPMELICSGPRPTICSKLGAKNVLGGTADNELGSEKSFTWNSSKSGKYPWSFKALTKNISIGRGICDAWIDLQRPRVTDSRSNHARSCLWVIRKGVDSIIKSMEALGINWMGRLRLSRPLFKTTDITHRDCVRRHRCFHRRHTWSASCVNSFGRFFPCFTINVWNGWHARFLREK